MGEAACRRAAGDGARPARLLETVDNLLDAFNTVGMKDTILSEIRRLAEENGGKAPGKVTFQREAGISESDWYGKIWLRWNDAIVEAGLKPNEKQERLSSDLVLQKYIEVCRHYGKIPSSAELRYYARNASDFLSHNTFSKHFGNKTDLIAALRNWAIEHNEVDLIGILPHEKAAGAKPLEPRIDGPREGWVYLLQSGAHYKIGRSDEIEKRVKQISTALPEKVKLVHAIRTDDPPGIEAYWHRRFDDLRANGEWFGLKASHVKAFKRRKFQ